MLEERFPALLVAPSHGVLGGTLDAADAPVAAEGVAAPAEVEPVLTGSSVVHAAARALATTGDAAVGQMGGGLSHNLAIALTRDSAPALAPPLLEAGLRALGAMAEASAADA